MSKVLLKKKKGITLLAGTVYKMSSSVFFYFIKKWLNTKQLL